MTLSPGVRLGAYDIVGQLGAGGMGEVWRATDTKLKREVALKVLPGLFADDAERLARFRREAQVLASLNHPNIAQIYGLEDGDGAPALVMELVEGPTLADRVARGAIPAAEALPIAKQIADALEAAHDQGVIHRDLKPANVKVREDGTVKVLDFGLAKALEPPDTTAPASASLSPTSTSPAMTLMGMILGTAAYMAPEQAKGRRVDARADVWAFGAVLFEMLSGRRAFDGEDVTDVLGAVVRLEPNWDLLPTDVPVRVRRVIRACLEKSVKARLAHMQDVRLALGGAFDGTDVLDGAGTRAVAVTSIGPRWRRALPWALGVVGMFAAGTTAWMLKPAPPRSVTRFTIALPEGSEGSRAAAGALALSPDGTSLAYSDGRRLYLRSMAGLEWRAVAGGGSTRFVFGPAFSPDGQSVAFFSDGALKRQALSGGAAVTLCPVTSPRGLSWDASGLAFADNEGVFRVSANGGVPELIVKHLGDDLSSPQVLPGGRAVLFTVVRRSDGGDPGQRDQTRIVAQTLGGGAAKTLIQGGADGWYLPTGHLAYTVRGVLQVVQFDVDRLSLVGRPTPLEEGVMRYRWVGAQVASAATGALAFFPGPPGPESSSVQADLTIVDRQGKSRPLGLPPGNYRFPRVSPDGKAVAFGLTDEKGESDVWIYALAGGLAMRRLTFGGRNQYPIWSPDGQWVAFQSTRDNDLAVFRQRADGSTAAERLTRPESDAEHVPQAFSPDGSRLLYSVRREGRWTLWTMTVQDRMPTAFGDLVSSAVLEAAFSPDGRWVVYQQQSGPRAQYSGLQVFLQPFPPTGAKYLVGQAGAPFWSPKGDQLMINAGPNRSGIVPVTTTPAVTFGTPVYFPRAGWFEANPAITRRNVDWLPDGGHFVGVTPSSLPEAAEEKRPSAVTVVLNWLDEVTRRAQ